ncbi:MAG TPA: VOC family protein [Marmoricola sp.]|nr:VOC family protein [Marmoricola sp.]
MAIATYKDLCIDAVDTALLGRFWAAALDLELELLEDGDVKLTGPTNALTVWVNAVPEPVTVKQRVHLDIRAESPADIEALGATVVDRDSFPWVVMKDPEGGELCVFGVRPETRRGLMEVNFDAGPDAGPIAAWWGNVLGVEAKDHEHGYSYLRDVPNMPYESLIFGPVPEPKTGKNRIHLDFTTPDTQLLLDAGATLLRSPDDEISWHVLADPDGNEFCAFTAAATGAATSASAGA